MVVQEPAPSAPAPVAPPAPADAKPVEPPATPQTQVQPTATSETGCDLVADAGEPVTAIALTERIDPAHAPYPGNESERLLFRQLYETLVRVDCTGTLQRGLAASWRLDPDGRTWLVTLRDNARFTDDTPVTAATVRESWASDDDRNELNGAARRLLASTTIVDERTLAMTFLNQQTDPRALAHTDLAVVRRVPGAPWLLGTRGVSVEPGTRTALAEQVLALKRSNAPTLQVIVAPRDPRDLLTASIDLVLTRDSATLAYAATLPQFRDVPLEWQRQYVLLQPAPATPWLQSEERRRFVQDAIRGDARGAVDPFWWDGAHDCHGVPARVPPARSTMPRVVFEGNAPAAREIAERLVATMPRRYQRAEAFSGEPLQQALRRGAESGYVISVDRRPLDACRELLLLLERAPWLDRQTIVPIADSRLHAIIRRGKAHVVAEWDGGLMLAANPEGR